MRVAFLEMDNENTTVARCTFHLYRSVVQLDYAFGQWKTDPRAGSLGDIRDTVFSLIESVEYFVYIFFADTDTVVDNFNGNFIFFVFQNHFNGCIRFGVLESIG